MFQVRTLTLNVLLACVALGSSASAQTPEAAIRPAPEQVDPAAAPPRVTEPSTAPSSQDPASAPAPAEGATPSPGPGSPPPPPSAATAQDAPADPASSGATVPTDTVEASPDEPVPTRWTMHPDAERELQPAPTDPNAPGAQPAPTAAQSDAPLAQEPNAPPASETVPAPVAAVTPPPEGTMLDGHIRQGPFFSGEGSLPFVLHHTLMGAGGGFVTMGIGNNISLDQGNRERMLAGTLIGAGLGFATSAWWQYNNWVSPNTTYFGLVNSVIAGMALTGAADLVSDDKQVLAWTSFIGMEAGAWMTALLAGGDMPFSQGLLISSGAAWSLIYAAMLLGIIGTSGTRLEAPGVIDTLLIAPGIGAGVMALASARYKPSTAQILRANMFGAGVGAAVLVLSALVLGGFNQPTPYVLSMVGSAGAIAVVSIFWEESAERPSALSASRSKKEPYRSLWW